MQYKGLLLPVDALQLEANADAIISLYDLTVPNFQYALPNKTFEAMMFGLPLITNVALDLVDRVNCGIKVDYNNSEQIQEAIINLRDNRELRKSLGANGRKAFEEKYNWNTMEKKLYEIYDSLLEKQVMQNG